MSNLQEEEALGKPYDAQLARRLMHYLRPYKWRVIFALALVMAVTPLELVSPYLFKVGLDRYIVPGAARQISWEEASSGLALIGALYLLVLIVSFAVQYVQIRVMQRVGQETMCDLRGEIFAHLQRLPLSFYDRSPVGRLVTRATTDVDSLNELFEIGRAHV